MPIKDTEQLENELAESDDIEKFFDENEENFREYTLEEYLNHLLEEKNLSKSEAIKKSELNQIYGYHIFGGRKKTSRANIISIAVAMKLSLEETQRLLYYAEVEKLYVRNEWDSLIIFALKNKMTIAETNELLNNFSESPLLGNWE